MIRRALLLLLLTVTGIAKAQDSLHHMLRIYEDNDFMNIWGNGTDRAYTNGTRIDLYYTRSKPSRWLPKAGDSSINIFGWGIMQVMITPNDLSKRIPDPKDYPYSGGLFVIHSLHSSNLVKKYSLQTDLIIGMMGPPSLARQTQEAIHRIIRYQKPKGWDHQLPTAPILNLNVTAEKMLAYTNALEWIGGVKLFTGTALNGTSVHTLLRAGKMQPYFNGFLSQYTGRQLYLLLQPSIEYTITNALLDGGLFSDSTVAGRYRFLGKLHYGAVLAIGRTSISFTQTMATRIKKGIPNAPIGNLSLHVAW